MPRSKRFSLHTLADLANIDWKTFETFATETLRRYYSPYKLNIIHTAWQKDGARDAHASYLFGASVPQKTERTLAAVFRLWVEVKQRSGSNVDLTTIGKNLVRAVNEDVSKLIVVTNRGFSSGLQQEMEHFARRVRLDYCLIDGNSLLEVARNVGTVNTPTPSITTQTRERKISDSLSATKHPLSLQVELRCSFTTDPISDELAEARIHSEPGATVFLTVDLTVAHCPKPRLFILHASLMQPDLGEFATYRNTNARIACDPIDEKVPIGAGDHRRYIFVFFPRAAGIVTIDCFKFHIETDGIPVNIARTCMSTLMVRSRRMSDWVPPSREKILENLEDQISHWLSSGGTLRRLLIANAGYGKSYAGSRLRRTWLKRGAIEISLDGQSQNTDLAVMKRVFERTFPIEPKSLGDDQADAIASWLIKAGMESERANRVAAAVCTESDLSSISAGLLADIMATLLRRLAATAPLVLLFEDAHKSQPSALALIKDVQLRLKSEHILLFLTSREESLSLEKQDQDVWYHHLESLLTAFQRVDLPALSRAEAIELIIRSIPTLEALHGEAIIDQVGTSPFGIREAIGYLVDYDIAQLDPVLQEYVVTRPEVLRNSINLEEFTQATHWRIRRLRNRSPSWLGTFLDAGALLGRFFPLEVCLRVAGEIDSLAARDVLGECERLDILNASPSSAEEYGFNHDLVRSAVIRAISHARQKLIARQLFEQIRPTADAYTLGSLAYQAGLAEECVSYLSRAASVAKKRGRHVDAVKSLGIAIHALDPSTVPGQTAGVNSIIEVDEALKRVEVTRVIAFPRRDIHKRILDLFGMLLPSLIEISGGSGTAVKSALSEAMMLAKRLSDSCTLAEIEGWQGRHEFAEGSLLTALEHHQKADAMYEALADPKLAVSRTANLIRLAICFRQLGRRAESLAELKRAEIFRDPNDISGRVKILSNTGALFFYSDLRLVRQYWNEALEAAQQGGIPERILHCLINLVQVDFIEDALSGARERLRSGIRIAEELGLENSFIRILLYTAAIDMIESDFNSARYHLLEAEELSVANSNDRLLWRIRANLATVEEMCGDLKKSYVWDRSVIERLDTLLEPARSAIAKGERLQREVLPFVNVILRSKKSRLHTKLTEIIRPEILRAIDPVVSMVEHGQLGKLPNLLDRHCKSISGLYRFVLTE